MKKIAHLKCCSILLSTTLAMLPTCSTPSARETVESCVSWTIQKDVDPYKITFALKNLTADYLAVLSHDTPFNLGSDGVLNGDVLIVRTSSGNPLPYQGRLVQFVTVTPEAILQLAPHETKSVSVELSRNYAVKPHAEIEVGLAANDVYLMRFKDAAELGNWIKRASNADDFRVAAECPVSPLKLKGGN